jgi:hypothetical protein
MSDRTVVRNRDGSRTVTRQDGARWIERDTGPGRVERVYLDSPLEYGHTMGATMLVTGAASSAAPSRIITPDKTIARRERPSVRRIGGAPGEAGVLIADEAIGELRRALRWTARQDGDEHGGWLLGVSTDREVLVVQATSSAKRRERHRVELDTTDLANHIRLRASGSELAVVGDWHSHGTPDSWEPSERDLTAWERLHSFTNEDDWLPLRVGVIVTPSEHDGFAAPDLQAWVTRRELDHYVTEPATIRAV